MARSDSCGGGGGKTVDLGIMATRNANFCAHGDRGKVTMLHNDPDLAYATAMAITGNTFSSKALTQFLEAIRDSRCLLHPFIVTS